MPRIELELSPQAHAQWVSFLHSEPAGRLLDAGVLGDWMVLGFLAEVERYIAEGGPRTRALSAEEERSLRAAADRRRLSKPQKRVLPMFDENDQVTASEIGRILGLARAEAQSLVERWLAEGFLCSGGGERGGEPTYRLGESWRMHNLAANRPSLYAPRPPLALRPGPVFRKE